MSDEPAEGDPDLEPDAVGDSGAGESGADESGVGDSSLAEAGADDGDGWPNDWIGVDDGSGGDAEDAGDPAEPQDTDDAGGDTVDEDPVPDATGSTPAEDGEGGGDPTASDPTDGEADPSDGSPDADQSGESPDGDGESGTDDGDAGGDGGFSKVDTGNGLSSVGDGGNADGEAPEDPPTGPDGDPVLAPVEYGPKPAPNTTPSDDDGDEDEGGLRRVEVDRSESEREARPDTSGPDQADERSPPTPPGAEGGPGDRGAAAGAGAEREGPPPGHAVGAPDPEEIEGPGDVGSSYEGVPDPVAEPDVEVADPAEMAAGGVTETQDPEPVGGSSEADFGIPSEEPPDDEEMPLAAHIEEMIGRLGVVFVAVAVATAVAFVFAEDILLTVWYGTIPPHDPTLKPHVYGPLEKILAEIKIASLAGILVAMPVLVYQAYLFMRPGLYPKERRYFLAAVPTSLVLGAIGMVFAYFVVLPLMFDYFVVYSEAGVDKLAFGLRVTVDLIVAMLGSFAMVFQIPLLVMLAIMMGVTSRRWLETRRIYFWAAFLGVGFLLGGADVTGLAPIIIAATMIGLFEGTLALLRWTDRS